MRIVDLVLCASMCFTESNSQAVVWLDLLIQQGLFQPK